MDNELKVLGLGVYQSARGLLVLGSIALGGCLGNQALKLAQPSLRNHYSNSLFSAPARRLCDFSSRLIHLYLSFLLIIDIQTIDGTNPK